MSAAPDTTNVLRLWAAVVLLSLLEAWAFPGDVRGAPGALYVAANVLVFFAALLFLAYHAGAARGAVLLWAQLIFMFGIFRLNTVQLWRLAGLT